MFNRPITVLVELSLLIFSHPYCLQKDGLYHNSVDVVSQSDENAPPEVEIKLPEHNEIVGWDAQVRYSILVSDAEDGDSRYGEINPAEVLLELEYIPEDRKIEKKAPLSNSVDVEPAGLTLIRNSTCFGCHRDKTRLTGPSFAEISGRYKPDTPTVEDLATSIVEGSTGKWGNVPMPPNQNLSKEEAEKIASYILEQGRNKQRWIYPGLEGVIRVMERPANRSSGMLKLTASYLDQGIGGTEDSRKFGAHTIMLLVE